MNTNASKWLLLGLALSHNPAANAQAPAQKALADPPLLNIVRPSEPTANLLETKVSRSAPPESHEALMTWKVDYTKGKIWNPSSQTFDDVHLRSYQGTNVDPLTPYIAPMVKIAPGETIRAKLLNTLPADPSCIGTQPLNTPHCFNGTNMHTHGLWINPAGNSDNVLISINPNVNFEYEYNVPADHPSGTFWYHPHRHGSTALQVASGMAGALIIQSHRQPTAEHNGDIDTLLQATPTQTFKERTLVFQQIQYACYKPGAKPGDKPILKTNPDQTYLCEPGDVGEIENYDNFGPGGWSASGRYTNINGLVQPRIENVQVGQVERWRMIHAGVRDSINLQIRKLKTGMAMPKTMVAAEHDGFIENYCTGAVIPQNLIAADGLTTAQLSASELNVLQPGYRWDALMLFPEPGRYCVIDAAASASANVDQTKSSRRLLAMVEVAPNAKATGSIDAQLQTALVDAARININPDLRQTVIDDIKRDFSLAKFVPHPDVPPTPAKYAQELIFNIDTQSQPARFLVNGEPYQSDRIDRNLVLGTSGEWTLTSLLASHPFHIHVNPFQVVAVLDPNGKDVSLPNAVDDYDTSMPPDPQYKNLKGIWKDTIWVKNVGGKSYKVIIRSRYERYIGDFVLHCHILDHEDQGMMQNVRIGLGESGHGHH